MDTPTDWDGPVFLMNFPLSVSNRSPNNVWMDPASQGEYNKHKAGVQWLSLYRYLTSKGALVYILPGHGDFQDLPFVANLGCYLPHLKDTILLSNFTSHPRRGEEVLGHKFFSSFDYRIVKSPYYWEGEADLKWLYDNIYVGGIGIRSSNLAYSWMQEMLDITVITIEMEDSKLYHLDCVIFPLTATKALVNVAALNYSDIKKLEKFVEIIEVPEEYVYKAWTNSVRIGDTILYVTSDASWTLYEQLLNKHNFRLKTFDLSEFDKSGADLSCLCMHLNTKNRF